MPSYKLCKMHCRAESGDINLVRRNLATPHGPVRSLLHSPRLSMTIIKRERPFCDEGHGPLSTNTPIEQEGKAQARFGEEVEGGKEKDGEDLGNLEGGEPAASRQS